MNLAELQAKRDKILSRLDVARAGYGERSVEYRSAAESLAVLDNEIEKLSVEAETAPSRTTYASFRKGPNG